MSIVQAAAKMDLDVAGAAQVAVRVPGSVAEATGGEVAHTLLRLTYVLRLIAYVPWYQGVLERH